MSRAALMAEAEAWREVAELIHDDAHDNRSDFLCYRVEHFATRRSDAVADRAAPFTPTGRLPSLATRRTTSNYETRFYADRNEARVLAALMLELECRDEARALLPKRSSPKKRSSKASSPSKNG